MNMIGEFQNIINKYLNCFFAINDTSVCKNYVMIHNITYLLNH